MDSRHIDYRVLGTATSRAGEPCHQRKIEETPFDYLVELAAHTEMESREMDSMRFEYQVLGTATSEVGAENPCKIEEIPLEYLVYYAADTKIESGDFSETPTAEDQLLFLGTLGEGKAKPEAFLRPSYVICAGD
jgi:hypothetical protein